jgi:beta-glucosidase
MVRTRHAGLLAISLLAILGSPASAQPQNMVPCGPFTNDVLAAPEPREARSPVQRFELIKGWVRAQPYRILFLGDSLTERFDARVWHAHMVPRGVFNAGISGDRTEHLLWRLQHGNLDGPPPAGVVLLIGTNDLGHRPPEIAAEGIRANLLYLRQRLPRARILLLGSQPSVAERAEMQTVGRDLLSQVTGRIE